MLPGLSLFVGPLYPIPWGEALWLKELGRCFILKVLISLMSKSQDKLKSNVKAVIWSLKNFNLLFYSAGYSISACYKIHEYKQIFSKK